MAPRTVAPRPLRAPVGRRSSSGSARRRAPLLVLLALPASACLPVPFAAPPVKLELAGGVAPDVVAAAGDEDAEGDAGLLRLRAGAAPLQLLRGWTDRRFDVAAGWGAEWFGGEDLDGLARQGPYLQGVAYPWLTEVTPGRWLRLGLTGSGEVLLLDAGGERHAGGGGSLGLTLELAQFFGGRLDAPPEAADRPLPGSQDPLAGEGFWHEEREGASTEVFGGVWGEAGAGVFAEASLRHLQEETYWTVVFGLSFRLPALGGLAVVHVW